MAYSSWPSSPCSSSSWRRGCSTSGDGGTARPRGGCVVRLRLEAFAAGTAIALGTVLSGAPPPSPASFAATTNAVTTVNSSRSQADDAVSVAGATRTLRCRVDAHTASTRACADPSTDTGRGLGRSSAYGPRERCHAGPAALQRHAAPRRRRCLRWHLADPRARRLDHPGHARNRPTSASASTSMYPSRHQAAASISPVHWRPRNTSRHCNSTNPSAPTRRAEP